MNWIISLPLAVRLLLLVPIGVAAAAVINWAIYRLAYYKRSISPWSPPEASAPPRVWTDRIPIYGWWGLARETKLHGRGFWVRPMLIEIGFPIALAALYWWDVVSQVYLGQPIYARQFVAEMPVVTDLLLAAHLRFLAHAVLLFLMTIATFIDFDEKTIPSWVTDIGALVGLLFAAILPWSQLTHVVRMDVGNAAEATFVKVVTMLTLASPNAPPATTWSPAALAIGISCYLLWCFALLDRRWHGRLPLGRAAWLFVVRATYGRLFRNTAIMAVAGTLGIVFAWMQGGLHWLGLFNALVGMAVGGGIVWVVRIIGFIALKREAMGFGDVTLMAMIGTFVGWQACLFIFFLAPFAGLAVGIAQFGMNLKGEIPYGPYLCAATLAVVLGWHRVWFAMSDYFQAPWLIPSVMGVCAVLMLLVLWVMQVVKRLFGLMR